MKLIAMIARRLPSPPDDPVPYYRCTFKTSGGRYFTRIHITPTDEPRGMDFWQSHFDRCDERGPVDMAEISI